MSPLGRSAIAVAAAAVLSTAAVAACSSTTSPGSQTSSALNSASSAVSSAISSAVQQAGSGASSALSEASSAASSALSEVKSGVDATADVKAGSVSIGSDGHAQAPITVTNPTSSSHDYTIAVTFQDSGGTPKDVVAVTVSGVPANGSATATARSHLSLSGPLTAEITAALRH